MVIAAPAAYLHGMNTRLYRLQRKLRVHRPPFHNRDPLILRDHLALERTRLSNERTLLSYIRSSLYLLVGGIALVQVEGFGNLQYAGYLSLLICMLSLVVGVWRFRILRDQLDRYYSIPNLPEPPGEKEKSDRYPGGED